MYAVIATRASLTARKAACTHLCHMRVHSRQRVPAASSISRAPAPTHVITCNNPRDEVAGHKKCNLLRYCAVPQQLSGDAAHVLKFTRAHISELERITVPRPQSQLHDRPRMHPRSLLYKRTHSFKQAHKNRHTHTHTHTISPSLGSIRMADGSMHAAPTPWSAAGGTGCVTACGRQNPAAALRAPRRCTRSPRQSPLHAPQIRATRL